MNNENIVECGDDTKQFGDESAQFADPEKELEQEIQEKGLNAPRLTPALINATIVKEQFHVFEGSQLTMCCLTLKNGFTVTGESACVSPENFDAEIGQKVARDNATSKIWMLEGYLLKQHLSEM